MKRRELARFTPHTVTEPRAFRAVIEQVRSQDWCLAREEQELGVQALAVPLRDRSGAAVAALNVVSSARELGAEAMLARWLPLLREAAQELRPLL